MARTVAQIEAQIIAEKTAQAALADLNSPSQTAIYTTWIYIQAVCIAVFEQVLDLFKADMEASLLVTRPATYAWLQDQVLKFQYDPSANPATNVVKVLPDFTIGYTTVDESFRVVSQCSVTLSANKNLVVKVAGSDPPVALSGTIVTQLNAYIKDVFPPIYATAVSLTSDKVYIEGEVYYNGQYFNIAEAVKTAIVAYLQSFKDTKFDGIIKISEIENAIFSVEGVKDVKLTKVMARADTTVFASSTIIYSLSGGINLKQWQTIAGYCEEETTVGETFDDKITYIPVN